MKELSYNKKQVEIALINLMVFENDFIDLDDNLFYDYKTKKAYSQLREHFTKYNTLEKVIFTNELSELISSTDDFYISRKPEPLIDQLRIAHKVRETARMLVEATKTISTTPDNIQSNLNRLNEHCTRLLTESKTSLYDHFKSIGEFVSYVEDRYKNGSDMIGISSGIDSLDRSIQGFQKKKTYIIGGMEKLGKSRFCLNIMSNWLNKKIGGIFFSMEMQENDIHECILGNRCMIDTNDFGTRRLTKQKLNGLGEEFVRYSQQPFYIDTTSSVTASHIRSRIRAQKSIWTQQGFNCVWVFIDYIQRMVDGDNQAQKLQDLSKQLSDIARDEDVIMCIISQLSQEAEKRHSKDMKPTSFIKGSKGIRENSDAMFVLYDKESEFDGSEQTLKCYIVQRKGRSDFYVPLKSQLCYSRFEEAK